MSEKIIRCLGCKTTQVRLERNFAQVTSKEIHMKKKKDRYAMFRCNNDRRYPEQFVLKDHTSFLGGKPEIRFWTCKDLKKFKDWTRRLNRKNIEVKKNTKICSNHFEFGRPVD